MDEYGWDRGATSGIFAFGFLASMLITPFVGTLMERFGPQRVIPVGALTIALGLGLTPFINSLWGLYLTLGALTVGGSVAVSYIGHTTFLPNWFVSRRGLVLGITFSGVGVGGIVLFPSLQGFIESVGWREACLGLAALIVITIVPLNIIAQRRKPEELGLLADGAAPGAQGAPGQTEEIVDKAFAAIDYFSDWLQNMLKSKSTSSGIRIYILNSTRLKKNKLSVRSSQLESSASLVQQ